MSNPREFLESLDKEQLLEVLEMYAKDIIAMDGCWFQALEREHGMDMAMDIDAEAWNHFPYAEVRRFKKFFDLGEHPGLEGLEKVLQLNYNVLANETSMYWEDGALIFRVDVCRVQAARHRKGMEYHPCKRVGINEWSACAKAVDDRIEVECLSCYPDIKDGSCSCAWRFTIPN